MHYDRVCDGKGQRCKCATLTLRSLPRAEGRGRLETGGWQIEAMEFKTVFRPRGACIGALPHLPSAVPNLPSPVMECLRVSACAIPSPRQGTCLRAFRMFSDGDKWGFVTVATVTGCLNRKFQ